MPQSISIQTTEAWENYAHQCGLSVEALCAVAVGHFIAQDPLGVGAARLATLEHQARQAELEKRIRNASKGAGAEPSAPATGGGSKPAGNGKGTADRTVPDHDPEAGAAVIELDEG